MLQIPFKNINYASISRDGNWVAFPAEDEKGKWDVYLMNTAGGKPNRVTTEFASWINGPDLSPDVSQIVYDCLDEPNAVWKIKLVGSQGGGSFMLADTGHYPKWRPDGERIGYVRVGDSRWPFPSISGRYEIWSVKPDGSDRRLELVDSLTTRVESWSFCWSPDGKSIAWLRNFTEGYTEIMVRNLITGRDRQITFDKKKQGEIVWATNGEILYTSTKSGTLNLWMVPARGGEPTQVTQGIIPILGARISADNKTLMYSQQEYISHLWVSAIDGSNARQITTNDVEVISASFSPDGSHIAFVFGGVDVSNSEAHLYVMDHDGNNQTQLTSGSEIVSDCSWSTDGNWIAYSARGQDEPLDSSRVYLIQPIAPGPPRLICRGTGCLWSPDGKWIA